MKYISFDTCVWLGLIKQDLHRDDGVFEEICFWIENGHVVHIVPDNVIREWDRNKATKALEISAEMEKMHNRTISTFTRDPNLQLAYQPEVIKEIIAKRIERIDNILKVLSEPARETKEIRDEAVDRNLNCAAPNHSKDSFRDTVNLLTLIHHVKTHGCTGCYFSTVNSADFSGKNGNKHELHPLLKEDFKNANLEYIYCDEKPFGGRLVGEVLRPILPPFQDYLSEKRKEEEAKTLTSRKGSEIASIDNPDTDFLGNIHYIDEILVKKEITSFDKKVLSDLINGHESYKQYFMKNVGNNGLV